MTNSKIKISNDEIKALLGVTSFDFPKYTTQILNLANQNAQGTRPKIVGQMSELIQEFTGKSINDWENWYLKHHPDAIATAAERISEMLNKFRSALNKIDGKLIQEWVRDLVIIKTFIGLRFHEAILSKAAGIVRSNYRLATPEEEAQGIDGFIGDYPVSIKPDSYVFKKGLNEKIDVKVVFYRKEKDGILVDLSDIK